MEMPLNGNRLCRQAKTLRHQRMQAQRKLETSTEKKERETATYIHIREEHEHEGEGKKDACFMPTRVWLGGLYMIISPQFMPPFPTHRPSQPLDFTSGSTIVLSSTGINAPHLACGSSHTHRGGLSVYSLPRRPFPHNKAHTIKICYTPDRPSSPRLKKLLLIYRISFLLLLTHIVSLAHHATVARTER